MLDIVSKSDQQIGDYLVSVFEVLAKTTPSAEDVK